VVISWPKLVGQVGTNDTSQINTLLLLPLDMQRIWSDHHKLLKNSPSTIIFNSHKEIKSWITIHTSLDVPQEGKGINLDWSSTTLKRIFNVVTTLPYSILILKSLTISVRHKCAVPFPTTTSFMWSMNFTRLAILGGTPHFPAHRYLVCRSRQHFFSISLVNSNK